MIAVTNCKGGSAKTVSTPGAHTRQLLQRPANTSEDPFEVELVTVTISVKSFAKHNSMMPAIIVSVASCTEPALLPSLTQVSAQKRELSIIAECASSCPFGEARERRP